MNVPHELPPIPGWVGWALARLLDEREVRLVLDELAELHGTIAARDGRTEADRRYLQQLRQYPFRLAVGRARAILSSSSPRAGEAARAARSLLGASGLTATIILTVGLGIGGCATIFSLVDAFYLRPLPYPDADRLALIYTDQPPNLFPFSVVDFQALSEQQTSFERVAAIRSNQRALTTNEGVEVIPVLEATPGLMETWGLSPVRGRTPTLEEGAPDAPGTAMVTPAFAERVFGVSDVGSALGRTVTLTDRPYEVIGILPPSTGPLERETGVVLTLRLAPPARKGPFFLWVYGRLRPDVTAESAARELRTLNERLFPLWVDSYQNRSASWGFQGAAERSRRGAGSLLGLLMGAVGMVLLIALTNATNLLLARVSGRERELAVRSALGASRAQIWSHLLVESSLLAAGGAALGLAIARLGVAALPFLAHPWLPRTAEAGMNAHTVLFALVLAAGSGLLFAVAPTLHWRRGRDPGQSLRAGGRSSTASRPQQRSQRLLVATQLVVVTPLLTGATLLLGSFTRLQRIEPGFDAAHLLTMQVALSPSLYPDPAALERFWQPAIERLEAIPGVERVALATERPPNNVFTINNFDLEDRPTSSAESARIAPWVVVGPSFFDVMDVPLVAGRSFEPTDLDNDAPPIVVVDEAWVRQNYPNESPLGRRMYQGGQTSGPKTTVVGVVGSVPYMGVGSSQLGAMYQPSRNNFAQPWLLARTSGDPHAVEGPIREELRRLDRTAPVTQIATGEDLLRGSLAQPRQLSLLLSIFSAVALGLAVVGVYGIMSHSVHQRRGDIAVRLALGGAPGSVLARTLWEGMRIALLGFAVGTIVALALTGTLSGLLYGVSPRDPASLAAAGSVLLAVSAVACAIPAVRAVRVNLASMLREE